MKTDQIRPNQPLAFAGTGSVFLFALLAVFLPVRFAAAQSPNLSFSLDYDGVLNGSYQSEDITGGVNISF